MSYGDTEKSIQDNRPIELYHFSRPAVGLDYYYNSSEDPVDFGGKTYAPIVISRNGLEQSEDIDKSSLSLDIDTSSDLVAFYITEAIIDPVNFILYRENAGGFAQSFTGVVDSISASEPMSVVVVVPISKALEGNVLHITHSIQCPYQLYDTFTCKANPASFTISGVVDSVSGASITSTTFATEVDGWLNGGEFVANGRRRMILTHIGDTISVSPSISLDELDAFDAFAGCGHNTSDCLTKFSNLDNFGGEPYIPKKNPWTARIV